MNNKERFFWDTMYVLCFSAGCEEGAGMFAKFMALVSLLLVIFTLPVSLFFVVKVVQVGTDFSHCIVKFQQGSEQLV